jgi:uncharacterized membrane protein YsdA (DUF1294 family)/cold shock CspA family protein
MTRVQASLVEWKEDKGYGFARLPGGTERIFVHAKSVDKSPHRLKKGDELELEVIKGRKGRPAAKDVRVLNAAEIAKQLPYHLVTAAILMILAQLVVITGHAPIELIFVYGLMGLLSLYLYGRDKQAALFGWWRISELRLLLVDLFGGIVGGLLAQHRYRHKKSKPSYQVRTFVIVVIHAAFLGLLGAGFFNQITNLTFFSGLF